MKRTLKDTNRTVRFVIDNEDREKVWTNGSNLVWTANVYIDKSIDCVEASGLPAFGATADQAFALAASAIEKSFELNDLPVPVPEQDKALLFTLLRGIVTTWGGSDDVPEWRSNEYVRGQFELITETCRVATDKEYDDGNAEPEALLDRISTWIHAEVWK